MLHHYRQDWPALPCAGPATRPERGEQEVSRERIRAAILAVAICLMAAPVVAQSDDPAADAPLRYVALGDSWPEGAHCGGCRTFVDLWADALGETTGREIVLTDLTGSQEPGLPPQR